MRRGSAARGLLLLGVSLAITIALSVAVVTASSTSIVANSRAPDSTTVGRLSGDVVSDRIQATTAITDAAWLASGLLATAIEVKVDLPLIER
jgi:hypothetical protein